MATPLGPEWALQDTNGQVYFGEDYSPATIDELATDIGDSLNMVWLSLNNGDIRGAIGFLAIIDSVLFHLATPGTWPGIDNWEGLPQR